MFVSAFWRRRRGGRHRIFNLHTPMLAATCVHMLASREEVENTRLWIWVKLQTLTPQKQNSEACWCQLVVVLFRIFGIGDRAVDAVFSTCRHQRWLAVCHTLASRDVDNNRLWIWISTNPNSAQTNCVTCWCQLVIYFFGFLA